MTRPLANPTAAATAAGQAAALRLVIFDCDGVLIDSEALAGQVCAEEISKLGWALTAEDSKSRFIGYQLADMVPVIEAALGRAAPAGWVEMLQARLVASFDAVETVPGAAEALAAMATIKLPFRVASNSSHEEMAAKFQATGLEALTAGRRHSAHDVPRGKPAPDVFLAAAAAEGVSPAECLVVEDSVPGVRAAVAAGMAVLGLDVAGDGAALRAAGAEPISSLAALAPLLARRLRLAP